VYEPITVEIDRGCGEGDYRSHTIFFIGHLIRIVKAGHITMSLYEWAELGRLLYLVHVEENRPDRPPRSTLYRSRHKRCNTWVEFAWQINRATRSSSA
jgi:hypothetical protein